MSQRAEQAKSNFLNGMNCAQSVAAAFADVLPIAKEQLLAASRPLGGGIGRLREMCGTVAAAAMCLGMLFPDVSKNDIYALVQEHAYKFREKNKTFRCRRNGARRRAAHARVLRKAPLPAVGVRRCRDFGGDACFAGRVVRGVEGREYSLRHAANINVGQRATFSRGRNRARSGNGAHNAPFPSSQTAKSPPGSLQESVCSPRRGG